jgi:hypothetical protein
VSVSDQYAEKLSLPFDDMEQSCTLEKEDFGMSHCDAGGTICDTWRFPPSLKVCMTTHHEPVEGRLNETANTVRLACSMAESLGFPEIYRKASLPAMVLPERLRHRPELMPDRLLEQINQHIGRVG